MTESCRGQFYLEKHIYNLYLSLIVYELWLFIIFWVAHYSLIIIFYVSILKQTVLKFIFFIKFIKKINLINKILAAGIGTRACRDHLKTVQMNFVSVIETNKIISTHGKLLKGMNPMT